MWPAGAEAAQTVTPAIVEERLAAAKTAMLTDQEAALNQSRDAQAMASRLPPGPARSRLELHGMWLEGEALTRLGWPERAEPIILRALRLAQTLETESGLYADILTTSSSIYARTGRPERSLDALLRAHALYRSLGNTRSQAIVLEKLAIIYTSARDFERALNYSNEAEAIADGDTSLMLVIQNNRGNIYREMDRYGEAAQAYEIALAQSKKMNSPGLEAQILTNIALVLLLDGNIDGAAAMIAQLNAFGGESTAAVAGFVSIISAEIDRQRGDLPAALAHLEAAFQTLDVDTATTQSRQFFRIAETIYRSAGRHERAYQLLKIVNRLDKEVMQVASSTTSALMMAKFDAQNSELTIAKLEADQFRKNVLLQRSQTRNRVLLFGAIASVVIISLLFRIAAARRSKRDAREAHARLLHTARHDALTGLANRTHTHDLLEEAMQDAEKRGMSCDLLLIDLDEFKEVNDTFGHGAGDELLALVSKRLKALVREEDHVGRIGGDEFAVFVRSSQSRESAHLLAQRIIDALSEPFNLSDGRVTIGGTIGIAHAPQDGRDVETLTRSADLALYEAKNAGRGRYLPYNEGMHTNAEERRILLGELKTALNDGSLSVHYQPLVSSVTGEVCSYEGLLRWQHPERGMIPPAQFIPLAEEAGLIQEIGYWVMRTACEDALSWDDKISVAVNVSPLQIDDAFPGRVLNALSSSGLDPERLELEVTESVFLRNGRSTKRQLAQVRELGVKLALDDFGTGYSSLGYLQRADFTKIKIDRSFVLDAAGGCDEGVAIIEAIVKLAEGLGMTTVAEGIEDTAHAERMRTLGVNQLQGYLFGKPKPIRAANIPNRPSAQKRKRPARESKKKSATG